MLAANVPTVKERKPFVSLYKALLTEYTLLEAPHRKLRCSDTGCFGGSRNSTVKSVFSQFLIAFLFLCVCRPAIASNEAYFNQITDTIYKVENSARFPYGIKSIHTYGNKDLARKYCLNTVRNNFKRWVRAGKPGAFTDYLADRYCPKSVDPIGNINWKRNIKRLLP